MLTRSCFSFLKLFFIIIFFSVISLFQIFLDAAYSQESPTVTLTIEATDTNGDTRSMWNELILDGQTIDTGFTPESYQVTPGVEHTVFTANHKQYIFDHWEDGNSNPYRTITINQDTIITAFYLAEPKPSISILPDTLPGLSATAISPSQINLSWSTPFYEDGFPIPNYQTEVKAGTGSWSTLVPNAGISKSYSHTDLTANTTYSYRISEFNSDEGSVYGVYVGLYTDPGDGNSLSSSWQRVYNAKVAFPDVRIIITANPSSGPGSSPRDDYEYSIATLRSVGVNVIGYVPTNWNNAPIKTTDVRNDIDKYVSWYGDKALGPGLGITGIMLDEMASDYDENGFNGDNVEWYASLTHYIKNTKRLSFVQGNPGTDTIEQYIGSVDQMKVYEGGSNVPNLADLFDDWKLNYSINNFAMIPHTVPFLDENYIREAQQYMSDIYIQDDGADGNPWDSLSSHFERIVAIQSEGNSRSGSSSVPIIEASATTHLPPAPNWIKFNAGLWSEDKITDSRFIEGIMFLQSQGFIKLTESSIDTQNIPPWLKNNASWWSKDLISDSDFISGVEYLISSGILII